ncbi:MAG: glycerate kinase [Planctomycetota bacterium]|jgi:glycerate kinase
MKVVLAPNALKGSLSALEACEAMRAGVSSAHPKATVISLPVSDGGDGFVEVVRHALGGEIVTTTVAGPLGHPVDAEWLFVRESATAFIESARACGLSLLDEDERNPMVASSVGVGELIATALDAGCRTVHVGLGGSATSDGGMGMAVALGARFLDREEEELPPSGSNLALVDSIDLTQIDARLAFAQVLALCDVTNPLLGERGAAAVYGPQKGAAPDQVRLLEAGLARIALGREEKAGFPGAGAAGGLGFGIAAFLGGELRPGLDALFAILRWSDAMEGAHLVLTAEGRLDEQTIAHGKAPAGVARAAKLRGVPCYCIAGTVADSPSGFDAAFALRPASMPLARAMEQAASLLRQASERAMRAFLAE